MFYVQNNESNIDREFYECRFINIEMFTKNENHKQDSTTISSYIIFCRSLGIGGSGCKCKSA